MKPQIFKHAVINAVLTAGYIVLIASFMFYNQHLAGPQKDNTPLIPIIMLSLLVFSAATTGYLIFGKPILWYLDGKKREAVLLLAYTLITFFVITTIFGLIYLTV